MKRNILSSRLLSVRCYRRVVFVWLSHRSEASSITLSCAKGSSMAFCWQSINQSINLSVCILMFFRRSGISDSTECHIQSSICSCAWTRVEHEVLANIGQLQVLEIRLNIKLKSLFRNVKADLINNNEIK